MLVKCAYFMSFVAWQFSSYVNQKYIWLALPQGEGGGHLPQMPHPGSAIAIIPLENTKACMGIRRLDIMQCST